MSLGKQWNPWKGLSFWNTPEASIESEERSLLEQLGDLIALANKEGLYDAANWVKANMERTYIRTSYSTGASESSRVR